MPGSNLDVPQVHARVERGGDEGGLTRPVVGRPLRWASSWCAIRQAVTARGHARTVEPVFGQLKTCQKLTMMSRRGLAACENEWLLACAAHNLRKLHRHRAEG